MKQYVTDASHAIEGYKDLSACNRNDANTVISFDRIFLPITITGLTASLGRYPDTYHYAYFAAWFLLTFWLFLSWRYRLRMHNRFDIMKAIECCLEFKAHAVIDDNLAIPKDKYLRLVFYIFVLVGAAILGACQIDPCIEALPWYLWFIPLILALIFGLCCCGRHYFGKEKKDTCIVFEMKEKAEKDQYDSPTVP